jgi:hypothetical protein
MIPSRNHYPRILALDIRPQRFGYAVFEGSKRLLDCGANAFPPGGEIGAVVAAKRAVALIELFHPSAIVVRKDYRTTTHTSRSVDPILKSLRREARLRSLPLSIMKSTEISKGFRLFRARTKYEMAVALTGIFPELIWKLPSKRRTWEPEPHVMVVFGAIAAGFTYAEYNQALIGPPE